jgi:hypothetical protein
VLRQAAFDVLKGAGAGALIMGVPDFVIQGAQLAAHRRTKFDAASLKASFTGGAVFGASFELLRNILDFLLQTGRDGMEQRLRDDPAGYPKTWDELFDRAFPMAVSDYHAATESAKPELMQADEYRVWTGFSGRFLHELQQAHSESGLHAGFDQRYAELLRDLRTDDGRRALAGSEDNREVIPRSAFWRRLRNHSTSNENPPVESTSDEDPPVESTSDEGPTYENSRDTLVRQITQSPYVDKGYIQRYAYEYFESETKGLYGENGVPSEETLNALANDVVEKVTSAWESGFRQDGIFDAQHFENYMKQFHRWLRRHGLGQPERNGQVRMKQRR